MNPTTVPVNPYRPQNFKDMTPSLKSGLTKVDKKLPEPIFHHFLRNQSHWQALNKNNKTSCSLFCSF